eukprot:TRINITY_DN90687_c0_g1_i1.p1 TRINITY_DN90687_c0_g1~~TRINITY_DN90687_c0_g1_i1.p1  ORF type:complete len:317 (-),score=52.79 TRINITY_DN90687_c0_g1_i1:117-995(-)
MAAEPPLRIVITGGSGYVGRFLVPRLEKDGHTVYAVSRSSAPPLAMDVTDAAACSKVLSELKPDVIVHCAAQSSPAKCEEDPEAARSANVPMDLLREAAKVNDKMRFVFLSTDQVLDGKGHLVDESVDARPVNIYGQTKLDMEAAVRDAFSDHSILRLSFVYGPQVDGAHSTFLQFALDKLKAGAEFSVFTDQIRSCVYVDDVVETIKLAVLGKAAGTLNLGGPEALSRYDFCRTVAEHVGASREMLKGGTYSLPVPSPADISMNVTKLTGLLGRQPHTLAAALAAMGVAKL